MIRLRESAECYIGGVCPYLAWEDQDGLATATAVLPETDCTSRKLYCFTVTDYEDEDVCCFLRLSDIMNPTFEKELASGMTVEDGKTACSELWERVCDTPYTDIRMLVQIARDLGWEVKRSF